MIVILFVNDKVISERGLFLSVMPCFCTICGSFVWWMGELRRGFLQKQYFFYNKTVMSDWFVFGLTERIYGQFKKVLTSGRWPNWRATLLYNTFISVLYIFEQTCVHHQEVNCINTASGIVTLCKWPSGMQVEQFLLDLHTGRTLTECDYTRCWINTIDLLKMNTCLLETCRGLK